MTDEAFTITEHKVSFKEFSSMVDELVKNSVPEYEPVYCELVPELKGVIFDEHKSFPVTHDAYFTMEAYHRAIDYLAGNYEPKKCKTPLNILAIKSTHW